MRKIGSTETAQLESSEQAAVQAVMGHRRSTAERYYQILKKTQQAVQGAKVLQRQLGLGESVATGNNPPSYTDSNANEDPQEHFPLPSKGGLDSSMLEDIDLLFSDIISTNAPLTMTQTKNNMSESLQLITHVQDITMVKVYNRVKYLPKKDFENNLDAIPDEDMDKVSLDTHVSSQSGTSRKRKWCEADEKLLEKTFSNYKKVSRQEDDRVHPTLNRSPPGAA